MQDYTYRHQRVLVYVEQQKKGSNIMLLHSGITLRITFNFKYMKLKMAMLVSQMSKIYSNFTFALGSFAW